MCQISRVYDLPTAREQHGVRRPSLLVSVLLAHVLAQHILTHPQEPHFDVRCHSIGSVLHATQVTVSRLLIVLYTQ